MLMKYFFGGTRGQTWATHEESSHFAVWRLTPKEYLAKKQLLCRPRALRRPGGMHNGEVAKIQVHRVQKQSKPTSKTPPNLSTVFKIQNYRQKPHLRTWQQTLLPSGGKDFRWFQSQWEYLLWKKELQGELAHGGRETEWPKPALVQK